MMRVPLVSDGLKERFTGRLQYKNVELRPVQTTLQYLRDASGSIIQTIGVG